jgi:hypothetical protein
MDWLRALGGLRVVPIVLAISCTGEIGSTGGSGNGGPGTTGGGPTGGGPTGGGPTGGGPTGGGPMGPLASQPGVTSRLLRLNADQWENTVKDLLRLSAPLGLSTKFVAEPLRSMFDTNGTVLSVGPDNWMDYQTAAEAVAQKVVGDATLLAKFTPAGVTDPAAKATQFVKDFGLRVFRRPLTDAEVTSYVGLFNKGAMLVGSGNAFADGALLAISAFLQSPNFLYRTELGTQVVNGVVPLSDYEVATKLSYALTNSMPDDTLLMAAAAKQLETRDGVLAQATRLVSAPTYEDTVSNMHDQLLTMRNFDTISRNTTMYPQFGTGAPADMRQEALSFVQSIVVDQDKGFTELFSAPYTFANSRIRQIYGMSAGGTANMFVKTDLDASQRAGYLTHVGFLASYGEGATPSIIMRGVHIARDVLCVDIPPPAVVPMLPALGPNTTNRQRIETLTSVAPCNTCHPIYINPLGFGFENLDAVGAWRTTENGQPIDAKSSYLLDGQMQSYDGPVQLSKLIANSQQGNACYAQRWAEYLYGRVIDLGNTADKNLVANAGAISKANPSAKNLILNLVTTQSFTTRLP